MRRCCPIVVPMLPPTGTAGVGSLNPSPGPSLLTMMMLTAPWTAFGMAIKSASSPSLSHLAFIGRLLSRLRKDLLLSVLLPLDGFHLYLAVGTNGRYRNHHLVFAHHCADGAA